jgi:chromosome partitioning protein
VISIAVSSQKGGVGKTTVSINLAHAFARVGIRTLLIDADPQGSVGFSLARQSSHLVGFYDHLMNPSLALGPSILPTRLPTLTLLPSGQCNDSESGVGVMGAHLVRIRKLLRSAAADGYHLCLIDTAAGLSGVTGDVIAACDAALIPQQAEPLGIRSVPKLLEGLDRLRILNPQLKVLGLCLTMVQHDLPESIQAASALRRLLPAASVFKTQIPRNGIFVRASARGLPVGSLKDGADLLAVFDALRAEILAKLAPNQESISKGRAHVAAGADQRVV